MKLKCYNKYATYDNKALLVGTADLTIDVDITIYEGETVQYKLISGAKSTIKTLDSNKQIIVPTDYLTSDYFELVIYGIKRKEIWRTIVADKLILLQTANETECLPQIQCLVDRVTVMEQELDECKTIIEDRLTPIY